MVESMIFTWYPAFNKGVETARMPSGAVASWLEKAGKKKTTFLGCIAPLPYQDYPSWAAGCCEDVKSVSRTT
jgi:hypothetical protein